MNIRVCKYVYAHIFDCAFVLFQPVYTFANVYAKEIIKHYMTGKNCRQNK